MKDNLLKIFDRNGQLLVETTRSKNRLYKVVLDVDDIIKCLYLKGIRKSSKWHARLGHVNLETMNKMINKGLVMGIPKISIEKETCVSCLLGKQTRQAFPQATSYHASQILELIHGDLCRPITPPTPAQKRYVFVLIDDYSRYM
ncbi:Retrovirus-related Pol polyprotein from transposon TNT 1-94 [Cardamine amara subsp. amara]|uniref:Retrovirus-related Pol polyprotein from transposon TNT 1-94 n=1 Tax=Cardamine amara subsp. amara TaxID=228776 RepID=A0ABD1BQC5_CARAN